MSWGPRPTWHLPRNTPGHHSTLPDLDGRPRSVGGHRSMVLRWLCFFRRVTLFWVKRLLVLLAACGGASGPSSPASDGVRAYVQALRGNDPHQAYDLLAES